MGHGVVDEARLGVKREGVIYNGSVRSRMASSIKGSRWKSSSYFSNTEIRPHVERTASSRTS